LYHLERKSQATASARWRMNLTLYNAWVYQTRWSAQLQAGGFGGGLLSTEKPPSARNTDRPRTPPRLTTATG
jgi:hypothetical protein